MLTGQNKVLGVVDGVANLAIDYMMATGQATAREGDGAPADLSPYVGKAMVDALPVGGPL